MRAAGSLAGRTLLVSAGPLLGPPRAAFSNIVRTTVALAASPAGTVGAVVQKGAAARSGGLPLNKEAGKSDSFVATRREPDHLAHVGADVRLPGKVGLFVCAVDVANRIGQCILPWVPVDIRKSLVRKELPVVLGQETPQVRRLPAANIRADLRTACARSEEGGAEPPERRET